MNVFYQHNNVLHLKDRTSERNSIGPIGSQTKDITIGAHCHMGSWPLKQGLESTVLVTETWRAEEIHDYLFKRPIYNKLQLLSILNQNSLLKEPNSLACLSLPLAIIWRQTPAQYQLIASRPLVNVGQGCA